MTSREALATLANVYLTISNDPEQIALTESLADAQAVVDGGGMAIIYVRAGEVARSVPA